jgi:Fe-S cluster assembly ATP-binding protein
MTPEPLLQVRDLRVDVGERNVLKSVSLDVPPARCWC